MKKIIWTVIVIIVICLIAWYLYPKSMEENTDTLVPSTENTDVNTEDPSISEEQKTPIEIAFEKAKEAEIKGVKAKEVDATLRPVLKGVFDKVVDDQTIVGVKMWEEFGSMLSYSFNSKLTEVERDAIMDGLVSDGAKIIENTDKSYTIQKGLGSMWVITFYLNSEQKSGLEITF
ncbi:MAG: hypothetical protein WCX79_01690 [Candidatus Paceibacterota bacterium]|jgi:hypothetical protein